MRPIEPADKGPLARAFERLSEQSRYQRFLTSVNELSESELRYLTDVDHHDHEALIAFDPETGGAVAVARFVRLDDDTSAEAAVTVIRDLVGWRIREVAHHLPADRRVRVEQPVDYGRACSARWGISLHEAVTLTEP